MGVISVGYKDDLVVVVCGDTREQSSKIKFLNIIEEIKP